MDRGSSYLPSELQMAFLYAQLENLKQVTKQRRKAIEYYMLHLKPLEEKGLITLPKYLPHNEINYHLFALICRNENERGKLIDHLKVHEIDAVFHYIPLHSSPAGKKFARIGLVDLPVTDRISRCLLRLPVYYGINIEEQNYVVSVMNDFYKKL